MESQSPKMNKEGTSGAEMERNEEMEVLPVWLGKGIPVGVGVWSWLGLGVLLGQGNPILLR
jgi:hypothetical protein